MNLEKKIICICCNNHENICFPSPKNPQKKIIITMYKNKTKL